LDPEFRSLLSGVKRNRFLKVLDVGVTAPFILTAFSPNLINKAVGGFVFGAGALSSVEARKNQIKAENAVAAYLNRGGRVLSPEHAAGYAFLLGRESEWNSFFVHVRKNRRARYGKRVLLFPQGIALSTFKVPGKKAVLRGAPLLLRGRLVNRMALPESFAARLSKEIVEAVGAS
jgi:hypothetical protein